VKLYSAGKTEVFREKHASVPLQLSSPWLTLGSTWSLRTHFNRSILFLLHEIPEYETRFSHIEQLKKKTEKKEHNVHMQLSHF
jgi:hypothetical protein